MKLFKPIQIKNLILKNRLVMPPMCMYQVFQQDGLATSFHKTHYHSRALGGTGLIIVEATGVLPEGRITDRDLGLYHDDQIAPLKEIVDMVHNEGSQIAIQLSHAGRKSVTQNLVHYAPSPIQSYSKYDLPTQMSKKDIAQVVEAFKKAAIRADKAGFDAIEIHGAHGYLIHQFLSPISNQRSDEYGIDKLRFLKEVISAIKSVYHKAIILRISGEEFHSEGYDLKQMIDYLREIKTDIDLIHVSSGGNVRPDQNIKVEPGYQVYLASAIREALNMPVIAVGLINDNDEILNVLENDQADLVACGREILRDANLLMRLAHHAKQVDLIPDYYKRAYKEKS